MASGDTLWAASAGAYMLPLWAYVAFTSGDTEPSLGDTIWGDTSDENGILEYISLESGTWGGADAAGYMLLSNLTGAVDDWTSAENFTANSTTPGNDGTLTVLPVMAFATLGNRANHIDFLAFDDTVNEVAMFACYMPRHYAGGGITITFSVMAASATTLDTSWAAFIKSITSDADDLDTKVFAAPNLNQAVDAPSAAGETIDFTVAFTNGADMDSAAAGEWYLLLLMRDAQDGTADDMSGDAQLIGFEVKET